MAEPTPGAFQGEGLSTFFKKKAALAGQAQAQAQTTGGAANGAAFSVALELLDDNPFQPRTAMDEGALEELVASIARHGLLQAITVRRAGSRWQVIAGHRRVAAFRLLHERAPDGEKPKYASVRAQEKLEVTDELMALYALVENLQRDDLNAVDAGAALAAYQAKEALSNEALAERVGLEPRRVERLLRLSTAPQVIKDGVAQGLRVPVLDADGKPVVSAAGKEKLELRRLDLMAALELVRVHRHWQRHEPEKADKKAEVLVQKVLRDGWAFRRIQEHCQALVKGRAPRAAGAGGGGPGNSAGGPTDTRTPTPDTGEAVQASQALFEDAPRKLVIFKERLADASGNERIALAKVLSALVKELGQ